MAQTVLHLTAELWPYARTGGLGQAVADLADEQARSGFRAGIILPLYRVAKEQAGELIPVGEPFEIHSGDLHEQVRCWEMPNRGKGPRHLFLDHPASFDRAGIYGEEAADYPDNDLRFAVFVLGALEVARRLEGNGAPIIHAHDWHAALAPVFLRVIHAGHPQFARMACVVSVHNGGFQGHFSRDTLRRVGLPDYLYAPEWMEWYGRLNFLKGALKLSDLAVTVSPTHAKEVCTEVGGFGLQDTFRELGDRLVGIRNGIDTAAWDPRTDPEITAHYGPEDLAPKAKCKAAAQRAWGLPQRARTPLFGMSARLVSQKGLDLIVGSRSIRDAEAQFVFLGNGEPRYVAALRDLAREMPERVAVNTDFTDRLEHRLLAGADFLLMPSLYEPCGLTQMRAQRYGTLPLARCVGGLADTIEDGVTGILFDEYTPAEFDRAMRRALLLYDDQPIYLEHARTAMRRDFSWKEPLAHYADVYRRALARR